MKRIIALMLVALYSMQDVFAQGCSVCTKTAQGLGESHANSLNSGILYLAAIPLVCIASVGFIWYKKNK